MSWGSSEEHLLTENRSPLAAAVAAGRTSPPGNLGAPVVGDVVDVASPPLEVHFDRAEAEEYTCASAPKPQVRRQHSLPRRIAAPFGRPVVRARSPLQTAVQRDWRRTSSAPDSPSWRPKGSETCDGSADSNTAMKCDGYSSSSDEMTCSARPHRRHSPPAAAVAVLNGVVADCSGRTEPVTAPAVRSSWPWAAPPTPKQGSSAVGGGGDDTDARPPIPPVDASPLFNFAAPSTSPVFSFFGSSTATSGAASPTVWNSAPPSFPTSPSPTSLPGSPFNNRLRNYSLSDPEWTASLSVSDEGRNYTRPSQLIRRNRSPSLVGHTHIRSVTRRSSLLPKTKCINRILSVLDEEARPIENELAREREANEAIKQETKLRFDESMDESVQPWSVLLKDFSPVSPYSQSKLNPDMDFWRREQTPSPILSVSLSSPNSPLWTARTKRKASDERFELSSSMKRRAVSPAVINVAAATAVQSSSASCSVAGTPCSSMSSTTSPPLPPLDSGAASLAVPPINMTGAHELGATAGTGGVEERTTTTASTRGRKDSMKIVNVHGASRSLAKMRLE